MKFDPNHPSIQGPCLRIFSAPSGREWIPLTDILSLEGKKGYTWLNCVSGRQIVLPYPLKQSQTLLPNTRFLRVHRHYLLNRQFIDQISYEAGYAYLLMKIGPKVPISRRRMSSVVQALASSENSWLG